MRFVNESSLVTVGILVSALLAACSSSVGGVGGGGAGGGSGGEAAGTADLLVRGQVTREMNPYTYNEEIVIAPEAHAVIELRRYQGEDAATIPVTKIDVPFTGFPLSFQILGDVDAAFGTDDKLLLGVDVYNHAGTDLVVGDLVSEYSNDLEVPGLDVDILVGGLESCGAPNAGGFCL